MTFLVVIWNCGTQRKQTVIITVIGKLYLKCWMTMMLESLLGTCKCEWLCISNYESLYNHESLTHSHCSVKHLLHRLAKYALIWWHCIGFRSRRPKQHTLTEFQEGEDKEYLGTRPYISGHNRWATSDMLGGSLGGGGDDYHYNTHCGCLKINKMGCFLWMDDVYVYILFWM